MGITPLPPAPSRSDPANFAERADGFMAALPRFAQEADALLLEADQHREVALGAALDAQQQASSSQAYASAAGGAAGEADAARRIAVQHASDASASAAEAHAWASKTGAPVVGADFSAKHHAGVAGEQREAAMEQATAAAASASLAKQAAEAAQLAGGFPLLYPIAAPSRSFISAGFVAYDGQELDRQTFPDAWEQINAGRVPVIDEAEWWDNPGKRGCFTRGNGSTTFRMPDYNGKSPNSLGALFMRGDGALSAGVAGAIQRDAVQPWWFKPRNSWPSGTPAERMVGNNGRYGPQTSPNFSALGLVNSDTSDNAGDGAYNTLVIGEYKPSISGRPNYGEPRIDVETRGKNVTVVWVCKLFGTVLNTGAVDAAQLASDYAAMAARISALEYRLAAPSVAMSVETLWEGSLGAVAPVTLSRALVSGVDHLVLGHTSQGQNSVLYQSAPFLYDTRLWPLSTGQQHYHSAYCGGGITTAISVLPSTPDRIWGENFTNGYPIRAIRAVRYGSKAQ